MTIVNSEPVLPYRTNSFVGTEEYIAPEVVNGVSQSSAVDWWTLGILIYEMLTGTTPFKGNVADETFHKIVNNQLRWPDDINVSTDCKNLVKKLLKREPEKRLGSENGASDIKAARWFKDFNFALIRVRGGHRTCVKVSVCQLTCVRLFFHGNTERNATNYS